jgi:hypothetical protein
MPTYTCSTSTTPSYTCSTGSATSPIPVAHPQAILDQLGLPIQDEFGEMILDEGT